ncbi:MAG: hypothetical protein Q4D38_14415 [Planctomycetia bacterium]|nr:hypothetical protein [Planctomycetia bacterium]
MRVSRTAYSARTTPTLPSRLSKSETWGLVWSFQSPSGDGPSCGMIAVSSDWRDGEIWHFVSVDGVYVSTDSGKTLKKVL